MPADDQFKKAVFSVRMTEAEKELTHRAADVAGKPGSTWAREVLLDAARERLRQYLGRVLEERPGGSGHERTREKVVAGE